MLGKLPSIVKDALNYSYSLHDTLHYLGLYEDLMGFYHRLSQ